MKTQSRRWLIVAIALPFIFIAIAFYRPPIMLIPFHVWEAIPSSVIDSDGRVGKIYRAPHGTLELVVFNKGKTPRHGTFIDRWLLPSPETQSVFIQCTVNPTTLDAGDYHSDRVFQDFLLSRIDGNGWSSAGTIADIRPEGHPKTYILSNYQMGSVPDHYKVKFQILGRAPPTQGILTIEQERRSAQNRRRFNLIRNV